MKKKLKFKVKEKAIFGLIREKSLTTSDEYREKEVVSNEESKGIKGKRKKKEGSFNTGRWMPDEHQRFIEALLKYGNEWKNVQKYVGTRSSTQARSHAQKFFVKIGKTQIENMTLDFENNSLKSLNLLANNLDYEKMTQAINTLNRLAFDKKSFKKTQGNKSTTNPYSNNHILIPLENIEASLNCNMNLLNQTTLTSSSEHPKNNFIKK
jgi:SHAQKYF class myb-like DNA-binding protein